MSTKEEEVPATEEYVKTIGNEILFYADVDRENALDFVDKFKKLEIELLKKKAELVGYQPSIRVHIMSEGGYLCWYEHDERSRNFTSEGYHHRPRFLL